MSEDVLARIFRRTRGRTACRGFTDAQQPGGEFSKRTRGGDSLPGIFRRARGPGSLPRINRRAAACRGFSKRIRGADILPGIFRRAAACRGFSDARQPGADSLAGIFKAHKGARQPAGGFSDAQQPAGDFQARKGARQPAGDFQTRSSMPVIFRPWQLRCRCRRHHVVARLPDQLFGPAPVKNGIAVALDSTNCWTSADLRLGPNDTRPRDQSCCP